VALVQIAKIYLPKVGLFPKVIEAGAHRRARHRHRLQVPARRTRGTDESGRHVEERISQGGRRQREAEGGTVTVNDSRNGYPRLPVEADDSAWKDGKRKSRF